MTLIGKLLRYATGRLKTIADLKLGDTVYLLSLPSVLQTMDFNNIARHNDRPARAMLTSSGVITATITDCIADHDSRKKIMVLRIDKTKGSPRVSGRHGNFIKMTLYGNLGRMQITATNDAWFVTEDFKAIAYQSVMSPYKEEFRRHLRKTEKGFHKKYSKMIPHKEIKRFAKVAAYLIDTA